MTRTKPFVPPWRSPPGDTIADVLEERGWGAELLAERLGVPGEIVSGLIAGHGPITAELAAGLAEVLGGSVAFWVARGGRS